MLVAGNEEFEGFIRNDYGAFFSSLSIEFSPSLTRSSTYRTFTLDTDHLFPPISLQSLDSTNVSSSPSVPTLPVSSSMTNSTSFPSLPAKTLSLSTLISE